MLAFAMFCVVCKHRVTQRVYNMRVTCEKPRLAQNMGRFERDFHAPNMLSEKGGNLVRVLI